VTAVRLGRSCAARMSRPTCRFHGVHTSYPQGERVAIPEPPYADGLESFSPGNIPHFPLMVASHKSLQRHAVPTSRCPPWQNHINVVYWLLARVDLPISLRGSSTERLDTRQREQR